MDITKVNIVPRTLYFKHPAKTSRGVYLERKVWYVCMTSILYPDSIGVGECAPLPGLSCDNLPNYEQLLAGYCREIETNNFDIPEFNGIEQYPSMEFGVRTALQHFEANRLDLGNDTPFANGKQGIPTNGLVWMGDHSYMFEQIKQKIEDGFGCIKLKIGGIDFEEELELLRYVRQHFSPAEMELRVDANGAFSPSDALEKLKRLSDFGIHSIEQPIAAGQWDAMADLVRQSPISIALDEELIGVIGLEERKRMLTHIHPHFIVIKPSLHGRMDTWTGLAQMEEINCGWWATSALESNIGLNAIAQATARNIEFPGRSEKYHGLGTGMLFKENVEVPLSIKKGELWFSPREEQEVRL